MTVRPKDLHADEMEALLADLSSRPWPMDVAEARVHYDSWGPPIAGDVAVEKLAANGVPAQLLTPPGVLGKRALLFLHGGGYVYGSLVSHGGMAAEIARASRCAALQVDYRRAPEHPFPAAVEDACAAYKWLLARGYEPEHVAFVGDSAGGGLVLTTLAALKAEGTPLPGAAVCISPWTDLEATGESYRTRKSIDPLIDREVVDLVTKLYLAGQDARTPTASPIHADVADFPPLLIQVGEREVLFSDAERFANKAAAAGVDVIFEEWPGMVHVWHLHYPRLTRAREAIARVGSFIIDNTAESA
jgi:acetyl esterase/lipase